MKRYSRAFVRHPKLDLGSSKKADSTLAWIPNQVWDDTDFRDLEYKI